MRRSRDRSSSQMETPLAARSCRAAAGHRLLDFLAEAALFGRRRAAAPTSAPVSLRARGAVSVTGRDAVAVPRTAARESLAALTTASGVNPNSRNRVAASAGGPSCPHADAAAREQYVMSQASIFAGKLPGG